MIEMTPETRMVWVDIETTGLDPLAETILEVGFRITDVDLETVDEFDVLIFDKDTEGYMNNASDFVKDMHSDENSGLYSALRGDSDLPGFTDAEALLVDWLSVHGIGKDDPICGSSVGFDRGFLAEQLPEVEAMFSYRNIDNSTIKELCRRYNPPVYEKLKELVIPKKKHRVMDDLDDTIAEHRFYRDNFLWIAA